jgi:hypothetical protein
LPRTSALDPLEIAEVSWRASFLLSTFVERVAVLGILLAQKCGSFDMVVKLYTQALTVPHIISGLGGSTLYFGVVDVSNPFTKVAFGTTTGVDIFGFDDFTVASATQVVPEPSSFALLGSALVLFGGYTLWRRRHSRA